MGMVILKTDKTDLSGKKNIWRQREALYRSKRFNYPGGYLRYVLKIILLKFIPQYIILTNLPSWKDFIEIT